MQIKLRPGKYVLAVSGGVDSISLLDLMDGMNGVEIIVAHFNHGIRADAHLDEKLVLDTAVSRNLPVAIGYGELGPKASEEQARNFRYEFLNQVARDHQADGIVTAHHLDDLLETALLNILRGTGRRGVSAISDSQIIRPLLDIPKSKVISYALANNLDWRYDSTNDDDKYLRNRLRKSLDKMGTSEKKQVLINLQTISKANKAINYEIATLSQLVMVNGQIERSIFIKLPTNVSNELIVYWIRELGLRQYDKKLVNRLTMALKTAQSGTKYNVFSNTDLEIEKKFAHFTTSG